MAGFAGGVFAGMADVFTGALGVPVTLRPSGGPETEIRAIVVRRAVDDAGQVIRQPGIHARAQDVAGLVDGDEVEVDGEVFLARVFRPDGRGMMTVELEAKP